jgi:hypothetical protein
MMETGMDTAEDGMTEEMAQAIREVINFSRFDERYHNLERAHAARAEYFEQKFAEIAEFNGVDKEELRDWLKQLVKPESFGLEVREYKGEEYVVSM